MKCSYGLNDVCFETGDGNVVKGHRVILCARSNYFKAMLKKDSGFSEASMDTIRVQVDTSEVFEIVLRYMYTGVTELEPDNCFDLLNASHLYGLLGLQMQCEDYIAKECIDVENVIEVMNATSNIFVPRLKLYCVTFLILHFEEMNQIITIEDVDVVDEDLKEFIVDRYYHWNQGRLWGDVLEEEGGEEDEGKMGESKRK